MTFEEALHTVIAKRVPAPGGGDLHRDSAAALVATHAPHLLKRFAILAGSLQTLTSTGGQGVILACRNGPLGYRTAEYRSHNLHIVLDASEHEAHLWWDANGETGMHILDGDTTEHDLDRIILRAVSALMRADTEAKSA